MDTMVILAEFSYFKILGKTIISIIENNFCKICPNLWQLKRVAKSIWRITI